MELESMLKISRDDVDEILKLADRIQGNLHNCPHLSALKIEADLKTLREMAGDLLPGGYAGPCGHCEEILGEDEIALSATDGTLYFCASCAEEYRRACDTVGVDPGLVTETQE